ncbi:GATA transcription factor 26 [Musa troglodytarum]|uniref:GATA transcription factor 26 n=1 Tax=Musa troglodytarum TaxID=320322 RepID=A0A9E7JHJ1_9LILI|nr:GATA transcription factor 26 [Musa troglodytarum]
MEATRTSNRSLPLRVENPFSLKVAQVFTGFGIGCGVGIGIGRPIYLGAIPAVQQVLTAARGATDAFSGVGRHVNGSLKKLGLKNIEVGIGCGVGIGHGFGVGIALKPGVVNRIQNCFGEVMGKIMMNLGSIPGLSSVQGIIPGPGQNSINLPNGTPVGNAQVSTLRYSTYDERPAEEATNISHASKETLSEKSVTNRTEKVINNFIQDPLFKDAEVKLNEVAGDLRLENNVLQMLLKHQQVIEELIEENQILRQILAEDFKVPLSKLQAKNDNRTKAYYPCSDYTPLWRNGPPEKPVLCNACGSRWRTKGSLMNYIPLHARESFNSDELQVPKIESISFKPKEQKLQKKRHSNSALELECEMQYCDQNFCKILEGDASNRSCSDSAISGSESCVDFGTTDAKSDLTGSAQSNGWDSLVPSKKRTFITQPRPKPSPVEKLTRDLYSILHEEQASNLSRTSEDDLLYESRTPFGSSEIGYGGLLIKHPNARLVEEESEASSFPVDRSYIISGGYSGSASVPVNTENKGSSILNPGTDTKKSTAQMTQDGAKRDKISHQKLNILQDRNSPLSSADLHVFINFENFMKYLTCEEQQQLMKYLPSIDTAKPPESLRSMFTSPQFLETLSHFWQLYQEGVFDLSFSGANAEECRTLKRLALLNCTNHKWSECYLKIKDAPLNKTKGNAKLYRENLSDLFKLASLKRHHERQNENYPGVGFGCVQGHHALDMERLTRQRVFSLKRAVHVRASLVGASGPNECGSFRYEVGLLPLSREGQVLEERRKGSPRRCCCRPSASQPLSPDHESERNMASYGGVLRRSAAVVERARDGARRTRKALARFARPQSFAAPPDAEAAAVRAVRNLRSFRLHYAILLWVLLLASLFPRRRATMLFLMAASKVALFCGALLKAFPNSALLCRIVDRRLAAALVLVVIGVELVMTRAVPQFLLAIAIGVPLVLLHSVFRVRDDLTASGQEAASAGGGELGPILEKKEDLELGSQ